jgi:hypothetical protein
MSYYPVQPLPDTNARQATMTVRPPSTSILAIDSEDRFTSPLAASAAALLPASVVNVTPYNFNISKNESLMNGFFTRVGVTEINFPWAIPNINVKTKSMVVNWSGSSIGSSTITLLEGFYTPLALAAALQLKIRALDASLAGFTMVYGYLDEPVFEYDTTVATLDIFFSPMPYDTPNYPFPPSTKQLFNLLGFTDINITFPQQAGVGGYTFCQFTRYVDIVCTQLTNNQALKDQTSQTVARDMLCRLYLGNANDSGAVMTGDAAFIPPGCAPFTIYRNFTIPKQIQWLPNQPIPGFLQFTVYDDSGAPLTDILPQGVPEDATFPTAAYLDWSMTMLVSEN